FVTSTGVRGDTMQHVTARRLLSSVLIGLGITLILTLLEIGILWLLNPLHLTGNTQQRFSAMLALPAHSPQWLLLPLGELAVASLAAAVAARPLALMAYVHDVHQAQEEYHKLYTPLTALANIRKTAEVTQEDITTPTIYMREEQVSILDLVQQQDTHMLILGVPGAGKTMALRVFQYNASQKPFSLAMARGRIPVYVPMKNYSLFLKKQQPGNGNVFSEDEASQPTILE